MKLKDAMRETERGVLLSIDAIPNAEKTEICGYNDWRKSVSIKIDAPPKGGKANRELVRFLEKTFKAKVSIVSGLRKHQKTVLIEKDSKSVLETLLNIFNK